MGELEYILGIQVTWDSRAHTIRINQSAYIKEVLERYGMGDCASVLTPLVSKERLMAAQSPTSEAEKKAILDFANGMLYPEQVGVLLYATQMRLDCQYTVSTLAQFSENPGKAHSRL
jgi:hypothetical protein